MGVLKAWEDGEDWRKYMRGYAGLREVESRLRGINLQLHAGKKSNEELMAENLVPPTDEFIESIAKKAGVPYTKVRRARIDFTMMMLIRFIRPITALLARKKQPCLKE